MKQDGIEIERELKLQSRFLEIVPLYECEVMTFVFNSPHPFVVQFRYGGKMHLNFFSELTNFSHKNLLLH